ncbi:MAG: archaellin/type IV pilin N-terminal domain-containing protein [Candidatus Aenigmatarchaeota archaeon]
MKKGISAVIATLLLLVITIGLAMTAYFYINNMVQRSTAKVINVEPGYCIGQTITIVLTNVGTENINKNEIKIVLNNNQNPTFTFNPEDIPPRGTSIVTISGASAGMNNLLIITPSGSHRQQIFC